ERGPRGLPAMLGPGPGTRRTRGVVDEWLELEERVAGADSERWLLVLRVRPDEQRTVRADELIDATPVAHALGAHPILDQVRPPATSSRVGDPVRPAQPGQKGTPNVCLVKSPRERPGGRPQRAHRGAQAPVGRPLDAVDAAGPAEIVHGPAV